MPEVIKQLSSYVNLIGADTLISNPTAEEKEAFEGILYTRGLPNISFIKMLTTAK